MTQTSQAKRELANGLPDPAANGANSAGGDAPELVYGERLRFLREEAAFHEFEVNEKSVGDFVSLLEAMPNAREAGIFLTDDGDLSAEWRTDPEHHFELHFFGDERVNYAIFMKHGGTDEVLQTHGTTVLSRVPDLVITYGIRSLIFA